GEPHTRVAALMVERLTGHDLVASAPSWDGQWLSKLLRAAGLPRHGLRLRDTEDAQREAAISALSDAGAPESEVSALAQEILDGARAALANQVVAHRALDDARRERRLWQEVRGRAGDVASRLPRP
ncbi:MAG TPA: transcriptional regulator, partial [Acetobacteraceae bacterium]|nr:transcriptional regulator [Acetobacteraceae bacterium]